MSPVKPETFTTPGVKVFLLVPTSSILAKLLKVRPAVHAFDKLDSRTRDLMKSQLP